jgi:hypothetical protein
LFAQNVCVGTQFEKKIPEMLPDEMRDEKEAKHFLIKWKDALPQEISSDKKTIFKISLIKSKNTHHNQ